MSEISYPNDYTVPKIWTWENEHDDIINSINRPTAGAREDKELPVGKHPFQLYSLGTPNGVKVTIMFEELLEKGHKAAEYDAWLINIMEGDQFGSGFTAIAPNSKIPAMVDRSGEQPVPVFESGSILLYLAEKFGEFLPQDPAGRASALNWLFWNIGTAPFIGGGFGHFYHYAPLKIKYAIDRYSLETKRIFDVANNQLADNRFLAGDDYTIADIAAYPWLAGIYSGAVYGDAATFLSLKDYAHVGRWVSEISERPAVARGRLVNTQDGLHERHDASDFDALKADTAG